MENLEYIDRFFSGEPVPEQRRQFEKRVTEDTAFAEDVAFYLNLRQVAKDEALREKKQRFNEILQQSEPQPRIQSFKSRWSNVAAAAILATIILGGYLIMRVPDVEKMADRYMEENFQSLGVHMGSVHDRLQEGIRLANENKLEDALRLFETIIKSDNTDFNATKYAGIVSLRLGQYDKALAYFKQLEAHPGLYANPGMLYQALALLKRKRPGDKEKAKIILHEVIQSGQEGKEYASEWLKAL